MSELYSARNWYEKYAEGNGLELTENADKIIAAVEKCDNHCPCKYAIWKKTRPDELNKIICPCEDHMKEIEETGFCHCHLFRKKQ